MPTRNMKGANTRIFQALDAYCADRQEPIRNAGEARWITTDGRDKVFIQQASVTAQLTLSSTMRMARIDFGGHAYFVTCGFDSIVCPSQLLEGSLDAGLLTVFLAEIAPSPIAAPTAIRDVVEIGDLKSGYDYVGLDSSQVAEFYQPLQVYLTEASQVVDSARLFLILCLADRRCSEQWMDAQLTASLRNGFVLCSVGLPIELVCRSVLELDPSALFLVLYRFVEALYSYSLTEAIKTALGIKKSWIEISAKLDDILGWRPKEDQGIEALFELAESADVDAIISAMAITVPGDTKKVSAFVARHVYKLRNLLVHYRPVHHSASTQNINWNRLCEAMASIVLHLYDQLQIDLSREAGNEHAESSEVTVIDEWISSPS